MPLSNTELRNNDSNVLRLPADKRAEYHEQVDRLIAELSKTVRSKTEINITKVVKAGSFAKYTILRKTSADPVDVDVVFYICGKSAKSETIESLPSPALALLAPHQRIQAPRPGAGEGDVQEDEAIQDRRVAAIDNREKAVRRMAHEIGERHLAR